MPQIQLNFMLAGALAILIYYLGMWIKQRSRLLRDFFIPEAVVGGLVFAIVKFALFELGICEIDFDNTLQQFFMTMFFTSVGFAAKASFVRKGGKTLICLGVLCAVLIVSQDIVGIAIAKAMGKNPLLGLCAGSMPLVGGHGSAGVFGPMLEEIGVRGALASAMAMATFGLIMGGLLGGPVASRLIHKHNLAGIPLAETVDFKQRGCENVLAEENELDVHSTSAGFMRGFAILLFCMGVGSVVTDIGKHYHLFLPPYLGSIIIAAALRNMESDDSRSVFYIPGQEIALFSELALNIFLSMALMSLNMWELIGLAGPLVAIAVAQMVLMSLYTYFVVFRCLGSNYEAAVMVAAICGFGLGAVPTAMANMQAITNRFGVAPLAFLLVPIIGSMVDGINATVIVLFINLLK